MFPMYQIGAHCMAPMHWAPDSTIGIILIKQMVFPLKIYEAIRIVHPFRLRRKMKLRPVLFLVITGSVYQFYMIITRSCQCDNDKNQKRMF
jgi:hypothetical protein